jgi:hypothetical protein
MPTIAIVEKIRTETMKPISRGFGILFAAVKI